jgi:hypothetical protein
MNTDCNEYALDINDVIEYIGFNTRPWYLGKELAKSRTHFPFFGIRERKPGFVRFQGFCLRSTLSERPHTVTINQKRDDGGHQVLEGKCSCKANIPRCKHIAGLMLKLEK